MKRLSGWILLCALSANAQTSAKELAAKATHGDAASEIAVADAYYKGIGTSPNYKKAADWYYAAAQDGSAYGYYMLGEEYAQNRLPDTKGLMRIPIYDPQRNMNLARLNMLAAAGLNYGPAFAWMGWYYEQGYRMGRSEGDTSSVTTVQEPAPSNAGGGFIGGMADAMNHRNGNDQTKIRTSTSTVGGANYVEAIEWYRKGADTNNVDCEFALGRFYEQGLGVQKDPPLAMRWYGAAAAQGHASAKIHLQLLFEQYGTPSAQCKDGTYSLSHRDSGTCSGHGGVSEWIGESNTTAK